MDISGLVQSYDNRVASSAPMNRSIMAPEYLSSHQYTTAPQGNQIAHQNIQQNPFSYNPYTSGSINVLVPIPQFTNNFMQQRSGLLPRLTHQVVDTGRRQSYAQSNRQGFVEEIYPHSPPIKVETQWTPPATSSSSYRKNTSKDIFPITPINGSTEANFGTEVDTLMKAIQAKSQTTPAQQTSSMDQTRPVVGASCTPQYTQVTTQAGVQVYVPERGLKLTSEEPQEVTSRNKHEKRRYICTVENCSKSFYQKTHLDIHERSHTGDKPYTCSQPGCGRTFSQLGNLKTHQRRHTGERPYHCELCGKRFAQRGNVRAHRIVHDQAKPYLCRLDDCGKQFTQLGNLKSHQNKFHAPTIRDLTAKFASITDGDIVNAADKDLWEYFANLYKNSNKGIKGRGKDRKVGPSNSMHLTSGLRNLGVGSRGGYSMAGHTRGNMVVGVMHGNHGLKIENSYDMFDADDDSQSGSNSGSASCYDDAPADGFEDGGRSGELAFGDRIY